MFDYMGYTGLLHNRNKGEIAVYKHANSSGGKIPDHRLLWIQFVFLMSVYYCVPTRAELRNQKVLVFGMKMCYQM